MSEHSNFMRHPYFIPPLEFVGTEIIQIKRPKQMYGRTFKGKRSGAYKISKSRLFQTNHRKSNKKRGNLKHIQNKK